MTTRAKLPKTSRTCVFCNQSSTDELDYGGLKMIKNVRAHYYCMLFSESINQSGQDDQGILGFMLSDILKEVRQALPKQCSYCRQKGASLGCVHMQCNRKFHLSCGLEHNVQQDFRHFTSYCHMHRRKSNLPVHIKRSISEYKCLICLENFERNTNCLKLIWADCCRSEVVMHLQCIKKLALSAGYFTKCPGCNNQTKFLDTIKSLGVFVPERDASWELGRDAYSELYYVHQSCDVEKCLCPQGRSHSTTKGRWKVFLCKLCGSFGAHQSCLQIKKDFVCCVCNVPESSEANQESLWRDDDADRGIVMPQITSVMSVDLDKCSSMNEESLESDCEVDVVGVDDKDIERDPLGFIVIDSSDEETLTTNNYVGVKRDLDGRGIFSNKPSSSNRRRTTALTVKTERRVALKSTTKLPFSSKRTPVSLSDVKKAIVEETKTISHPDVIVIDSDDETKLNKDNTVMTLRSLTAVKSEPPIVRRVAMKSTTKLPVPLKLECRTVEEDMERLEKNTINSLDDAIVIDSEDEDGNYLKPISLSSLMSNDVVETEVTLLPPPPSLSPPQYVRNVAMKSTTQLPVPKRKYNQVEVFLEERRQQYAKLDATWLSRIRTVHDPLQHKRSLSPVTHKRSKCSIMLSNLIKKVNSSVGNDEDGGNGAAGFVSNCDRLVEVGETAATNVSVNSSTWGESSGSSSS